MYLGITLRKKTTLEGRNSDLLEGSEVEPSEENKSATKIHLRRKTVLEGSEVEPGTGAFLPQAVLMWLADCGVSEIIVIIIICHRHLMNNNIISSKKFAIITHEVLLVT